MKLISASKKGLPTADRHSYARKSSGPRSFAFGAQAHIAANAAIMPINLRSENAQKCSVRNRTTG